MKKQAKEAEKQGLAEKTPPWWDVLPGGERRLIQVMLGLLESAKQSPEGDVAWAGRKWRPAMGFFIKSRLMAEYGRAERRKQKWKGGSRSAEGRSTEKRKEA